MFLVEFEKEFLLWTFTTNIFDNPRESEIAAQLKENALYFCKSLVEKFRSIFLIDH